MAEAEKTIPVLGGENWLTDPALFMNSLFRLMFVTDYSQSNTYYGQVTSLQYVLATTGMRIPQLKTEVEDTVKRLYSRYFESVDVEFNVIADTDHQKSAYLDFTLAITGVFDGQAYNLNETVHIDQSKAMNRFLTAFDLQGQ